MKCTNHGASEEVIGSLKFRLLIGSQVIGLPLRDMIAIHSSQSQFHLSTPNHEILSIKSNCIAFKTAIKPVTKNCLEFSF
jgi:hypothetical protein